MAGKTIAWPTSAPGHQQTSAGGNLASALPQKADFDGPIEDVR